ncbi:MAG: prepilin-type N-terminal cleavage/methylation domain-containing protein [Dehalococcoidales bacterium]|nr:MAG: prepilin-type N-terminal cleavage/methylation domain-containing protein [Dehalococcoidales bacterium]
MKTRNGFTLIELLMAMAVAGLLIGGLVSVFFHISVTSGQSADMLAISREFQNVGHSINRDGQMAKSATGGSQLVLTMPDSSTITYTLTGTQLQRLADGLSTPVGNHITGATFAINDRTINVTLTATVNGGAIEEDTFQVRMRPAE